MRGRENYSRMGRGDHLISVQWPMNALLCVHHGAIIPHYHDFIEIAIVLGGKALHQTVRGEVLLRGGDVLVLRPGAWHAYLKCRDFQVFNFFCDAHFLRRDFGFIVQNPWLNYLFWIGPLMQSRGGILSFRLSPARLKMCAQSIEKIGALGSPRDAVQQAAWLGEIFGLLAPLAAQLQKEVGEEAAIADYIPAAVQRAIGLLEANPTHRWTLDELAGRLHLNPSYLVRLFSKAVGEAPLQYLARHRAELAARLLVESEDAIAEIAARVGWPNLSYFSQRFKTHFGLTASAYRARFRTSSMNSAS